MNSYRANCGVDELIVCGKGWLVMWDDGGGDDDDGGSLDG